MGLTVLHKGMAEGLETTIATVFQVEVDETATPVYDRLHPDTAKGKFTDPQEVPKIIELFRSNSVTGAGFNGFAYTFSDWPKHGCDFKAAPFTLKAGSA